MSLPTQQQLDALLEFDTPTICNALEVVLPHTRKSGYTIRPLVCGFPDRARWSDTPGRRPFAHASRTRGRLPTCAASAMPITVSWTWDRSPG